MKPFLLQLIVKHPDDELKNKMSEWAYK